MPTDFLINLTYEERSLTLSCVGELDIATARKFRDAVDLCLERDPDRLLVDMGGVSLITSSGIEVLLHAGEACRQAGTRLDLRFSKPVRRVLDLIGLWWLGVIDDGPAMDAAFKEAMHTYSELRFDEKLLGSLGESEAV